MPINTYSPDGSIVTTDVPPAGWSVEQASTANAAQTLARAAAPGRKHTVQNVSVIITGAATGVTAVTFSLKDGTTVLWTESFPASAAIGSRIFLSGLNIQGSANTAMNLVVDAGGNAGCITIANMNGFTA